VKSQLENQNISFPAAETMPEATKDQLSKWADQKVTTGEMARDYSDLYIWEHMKASSIAVAGAPLTYSEVSGKYMGMVRGGTGTPEEIAKYAELRNTLFMGNTLRGMLLEAYAFGTLGVIAGYSAIAALAGGIIMLLLSIAGVKKRPVCVSRPGVFIYRESVFLAIKSSSDKRFSLDVCLLICVLNRRCLHEV
jgi:hypothetical protein